MKHGTRDLGMRKLILRGISISGFCVRLSLSPRHVGLLLAPHSPPYSAECSPVPKLGPIGYAYYSCYTCSKKVPDASAVLLSAMRTALMRHLSMVC